MSNLRKTLDSVKKKGCGSKTDEEVIDFFTYLTYQVIQSLETDKKTSKKVLAIFLQAIKSLENWEDAAKAVQTTLVSLPMMLQSRWDLLAALISSQLLNSLDDLLFVELAACAADQDLSARCSSLIVQLATSDSFWERTAHIIHQGLVSPVSARRSNVLRSWLGRITNLKTSKSCVERILELCRPGVLDDNSATWPVAFRQVSGLTCVDLEWKSVLEEEPFDESTFELMAYFDVLMALKKPTSQVKVQLTSEDEQLVERGVEHFVDFVSKEAIAVCQTYQFYPENLENAVMLCLDEHDHQIFGIVDEEMLKTFRENGKIRFENEKLASKKKEESEDHGKFYPAADDGNLKVDLDLESEIGVKKTLAQFLKVQAPTQDYPAVSAVMDHLSRNNIDERLFAQKVISMIDILVKNSDLPKTVITDFLFEVITKIPLRTVVDYTGEVLKSHCKDQESRQAIFGKAIGLLEKEEENTRALALMHCFIGTCDKTKMENVWEVVKGLKEGVKKRKMSEMLAKVVQSKDISVDAPVLYEMVLCSLHLKPSSFDFECTQLFVAAVSRLVDFRLETERIMLFNAIHNEPLVTDLISEILSNPAHLFSKSSHQMVLYLLSRFHVGAVQFYQPELIVLIARIVKYCHWCIRKFAADAMVVSIAVDAICGYLPWSFLREKALERGESEMEDPVERLIEKNMRHHRFWVLLSEHNQPTKFLTLEDLKQFPFADFIVEIVENKESDTKHLARRLLERVRNQADYGSIHANSLAFNILVDQVKSGDQWLETLMETGSLFERTFDPEYEVAMIWLGKAMLKLRNISKC